MDNRIFFSWQSDIRGAACRTLIGDALRDAAADIANDDSVSVEPVIDRDTQNVPGSPDIGDTIFSKIDAAAAFVADVTIIGRAGDRPTPNPNVLVETGYALKAIGESRIVLVQNTAFGTPEELPFDLRRKRILGFDSPADATERARERRRLQGSLKNALALILKVSRSFETEVEVSIGFKRLGHSNGDIHHYDLDVCLKNVSRRRIDDWEIEIEFPTPLMEPHVIVAARVRDRSDGLRSLIRVQGRALQRPLRPGEEYHAPLGYYVDNDIYHGRKRGQSHLFDEPVKARVLVDGKIAAEVERPVRELQEF